MSDNAKALNQHTSTALVAEMRARNSMLSDADARLAIARVFDSVVALTERGEQVRIAKFGTFQQKFSGDRQVRNPRTSEMMQVSGRNVLRFKASKSMGV